MPADVSPDLGVHDRSASAIADLTRSLDPDQRRAVTSAAPLLAVIAGAGSGKTSVLTRRVAFRCVDGSADPMHTAVITFTRQAASELRRRLRSLGVQDGVMAGTFHAISLSLLQMHWERIGRPAPTVVQDRKRLIGEVIGPRRTTVIDVLAAEIDWARARNLTATSYSSSAAASDRPIAAPPGEVERVMGDLEALKKKRGIIDLDDLLSLVVQTAHNDEQFASILAWRLRHLYVDEAQDMNPLQRAVLDIWRADRDDLTIVGDPSQAIYGFNGSDPTILLALERHFPGIEVVRLDTNYRCTPQIVRAGLQTLSHLETNPPALRSARPDGQPVAIFGFADEDAEAAGVADLLASMRRPGDSWRQFAVLARTNAQLRVIRETLERALIPVRTNMSQHDDALQQYVREVGDLSSRTRIAAWSRDARVFDDVDAFEGDLVRRQREREVVLRVADAVDEFLSDGGNDGRAFLAWVRTHRPFDDSASAVGVDLLTFHAAKGREWDTVILVGCEDGLVPHHSASTRHESDEEIRLAYVAETRAADRLVLTYAKSRKGRKRRRSPLIEGTDVSHPVSPPTSDFLESLRRRQSSRSQPDPVMEELRTWRHSASRVSGVDPGLICPDTVLENLARLRPTTLDDLAEVPGLGSPLIARVGPAIISAIERGLSSLRDGD